MCKILFWIMSVAKREILGVSNAVFHTATSFLVVMSYIKKLADAWQHAPRQLTAQQCLKYFCCLFSNFHSYTTKELLYLLPL